MSDKVRLGDYLKCPFGCGADNEYKVDGTFDHKPGCPAYSDAPPYPAFRYPDYQSVTTTEQGGFVINTQPKSAADITPEMLTMMRDVTFGVRHHHETFTDETQTEYDVTLDYYETTPDGTIKFKGTARRVTL